MVLERHLEKLVTLNYGAGTLTAVVAQVATSCSLAEAAVVLLAAVALRW